MQGWGEGADECYNGKKKQRSGMETGYIIIMVQIFKISLMVRKNQEIFIHKNISKILLNKQHLGKRNGGEYPGVSTSVQTVSCKFVLGHTHETGSLATI